MCICKGSEMSELATLLYLCWAYGEGGGSQTYGLATLLVLSVWCKDVCTIDATEMGGGTETDCTIDDVY